jgi:hypothetical protein
VQLWQAPDASPTREIVLHLCSYSGKEGSGLPDTRAPARYNVLMAKQADGSVTGHWPIDAEESNDSRAQRHALLWEQCLASVLQNAIRWEATRWEQEASSLRLVRSLAAGGDNCIPHAFRPLPVAAVMQPEPDAVSQVLSSESVPQAVPPPTARTAPIRLAAQSAAAVIAAQSETPAITAGGAGSRTQPIEVEQALDAARQLPPRNDHVASGAALCTSPVRHSNRLSTPPPHRSRESGGRRTFSRRHALAAERRRARRTRCKDDCPSVPTG